MRHAANDFSLRWCQRDADVLAVLQGAMVPSGRKIIDGPKGYGPLARWRRWRTGKNGVGVEAPVRTERVAGLFTPTPFLPARRLALEPMGR
jgi:hypothetical protein